MPPGDGRAGDVLVADSTIFSTLFGADESLEAMPAIDEMLGGVVVVMSDVDVVLYREAATPAQ